MISTLFLITNDDIPYLPALKSLLSGRLNGKVLTTAVNTATEVLIAAKERGCTCVATTSQKLLNILLNSPSRKASLDDYAGSILKRELLGKEYEFLILNPLEHLVTVSSARFVFGRYFDKFISPGKFLQIPTFSWSLFSEVDTDKWLDLAASCYFIAVDIETGRPIEREITCAGYTFVSFDRKRREFRAQTLVIPLTSEYNLAMVGHINASETAKVFQNGKYDNAYFLRYGIPVTNWMGDTAHAFHAWYSELPKRLDFIVSFMLRDWEYWKAEANTSDLMEYYRYNAKDAFTTAMTWIALVIDMPDWAWENYYREFPLVFPCLLCEMVGLKEDQKVREEEDEKYLEFLDGKLKKIRKMVGNENFNPSSPDQVVRLFEVLGSGDVKATTPPMRDRVSHRHPLNKLIIGEIEDYREARKLETTYFRDTILKPKEFEASTKSWFDRILYALNPHGTDTSRLASKESAFWCGLQIQNIPLELKAAILADDGFFLGEGDYSQNEARGTAYLSGDLALIEAVDDKTKDFHGRNAAAFFGLPYSDIVNSTHDEETDRWAHKTVNKAIRDTSKRTNHGANYNMTAPVLLATMGIDAVIRAKRLLKLNSSWPLLKVCEYLLARFDETYPVVRDKEKGWYAKCIADVSTTSKLVGPTGWTRYCFGNPSSNKRDLNRYVAHPPQSLGAQQLNMAFLKVFFNIYLPNPRDFKLCAQIHDSILFQYRKGREDLAMRVKEEMRVPIDVVDIFGVKRLLEVPVDLKGGAERWSELRGL